MFQGFRLGLSKTGVNKGSMGLKQSPNKHLVTTDLILSTYKTNSGQKGTVICPMFYRSRLTLVHKLNFQSMIKFFFHIFWFY